jgi:hypothetical protein
MHFDPDTARNILLEAEKAPPNRSPDVNLPQLQPDEMIEYIELLNEAGLLEAKMMRSSMGGARNYRATIERLTYEGHQFLAAARNETLWNRAKSHVLKSGGAMTIEVLKSLLILYAKQAVGLSEG